MFRFKGYLRSNGSVGIRNFIAAVPASVCASPLVTKLAFIKEGVLGLAHKNGCCQIGKDFELTNKILAKLCIHPNVGGVIFVALGCEGTPSQEILYSIKQAGIPFRFIHIQDEGGSQSALQKAGSAVDSLRKWVEENTQTKEADVGDLVVGLECGGSDATSGLASNPSIGWVTDELVKYGAKVILSETTELIGAEHVITKNVTDARVKRCILEAVTKVERDCIAQGVDIRGSQPTPGNIEGGLSTIEEKSMGCAYKSGSSPFVDYLSYGDTVRLPGLSFMDTPGQDVESMTGMAAGGANLFLFSTGRGSPVGFPIVPTIKITANEKTFQRMQDDIDVDVSGVLKGEPLHKGGQAIYQKIQEVCHGQLTKSEITGHHEVSIYKQGITL